VPTAFINGCRLSYAQMYEGTGAPAADIVMTHGLATSMAFWYFNYACQLAKQYRVTLFDLRGHGRSEMTPSGYSPENLASDLAGLLVHLGVRKAHFLGHSFGGVVALRYALEHPDRVRSLILADTHIAAARKRKPQDKNAWAHRQSIQAILNAHGIDLDVGDPYFGYRLLSRVARMRCAGADLSQELLEVVTPLTGGAGQRTSAQWLKLMESTSAEQELMSDDGLSLESLRRLTMPIMAMYGDRSPAWLTGTELLPVWPHGVFRTVRNAGHFFPTTRPGEVLDACRGFFGNRAAQQRPPARTGETQCGFFRGNRFFQDQHGWYYSTREEPRVGPFAALEEAESTFRNAILDIVMVSS